MTTTLTLAPADRDALLAAANLAEHLPNLSKAADAVLRLLHQYPGALAAWRASLGADGLSITLALTRLHASPQDAARSLRDAAGGAL